MELMEFGTDIFAASINKPKKLNFGDILTYISNIIIINKLYWAKKYIFGAKSFCHIFRRQLLGFKVGTDIFCGQTDNVRTNSILSLMVGTLRTLRVPDRRLGGHDHP